MIKTVIPVLLSLLLIGCSHMSESQAVRPIPPIRSLSVAHKPGVRYPIDAYDPWEHMNRAIYAFNAGFDKYVFLPIVRVYRFITPDFVEDRLSNFFNNIGDIQNFINSVLQLKPKQSLETAARFVVNSTVGIGGLWDPARKRLNLRAPPEDFGQTLGFYGVKSGPYLVLPILGPSSLRDGLGYLADGLIFIGLDPLNFRSNADAAEYSYYTLRTIDLRSRISFRYYETGSPFEYDLVRLIYLKKRELDVAK